MSFVTANYGFAWELWELQHKVIFDGPNKLITVGPETSIIDVKIDLYSDWKEWAMAAENMKWAAAFRSVGGDALPGAQTLGATFFLINGWRIVLDHGVDFNGNMYTEEGDTPFIPVVGQQVSTSTVSNLVDIVETAAPIGAAVLAQATWDLQTSSAVTPGSMGELLRQLRDTRILLNTTTVAGSTTTSIKTAASGIAAGFYDQHFVQVIEGTKSIIREIETYAADGSMEINLPLPFSPGSGAQVYVLSSYYIGGGEVS